MTETTDAITGAKSASLEKRLFILDREIKKLYLACQEAGHSPDKIREIAVPVLHAARRGLWKSRCRRFAIVIAFIGVFAGLFTWSATRERIDIVSRKFMVNYVLPYYDWTWPFLELCLMTNPYYNPAEEDQADFCNYCEMVKNVSVLANVNSTYMTETFFMMEPTIVTDAMSDWPATKDSITLNNIMDLYLTSPHLIGPEQLCDLRVTKGLDLTNSTAQDLIIKVRKEQEEGNAGNFTAMWSTCNRNASREMHKLYYKPYYLPGMCEPTRHSNYLLIGRKSPIKSKASSFNIVDGETGYWIGQVQGSFEILLKPVSDCSNCSSLRIFLKEGQILNVPDEKVYIFGFRPRTDEAVAIGASYRYT